MEEWGELLKRFGIRRTLLGKYSEEDTKEYKLLQGQHGYLRSNSIEATEALIRKSVEQSPHTTQAIIFHESGGGPFPMELIGGKTEITPEIEERDKQR